ncbi:unnamed protein product, partial [Symbiodinium sp. CCMP2456]
MQAYSCVELFAGKAWISRCFKLGGYPTASLDVAYGASLPNAASRAMDLTTTAGMSLAIATVLSGRQELMAGPYRTRWGGTGSHLFAPEICLLLGTSGAN